MHTESALTMPVIKDVFVALEKQLNLRMIISLANTKHTISAVVVFACEFWLHRKIVDLQMQNVAVFQKTIGNVAIATTVAALLTANCPTFL